MILVPGVVSASNACCPAMCAVPAGWRDIASRTGCEIVKVYRDHGISGAKGGDKRPGFDALHRAATKREFDVVMARSVDRLGRSLQDLVGFLGELHALGIDLFLHQQGLDTRTPAGMAMFQMLGVFAQFERAMIQERVRAGLARARGEGKRLGRPSLAGGQKAAAIRAALARGNEVTGGDPMPKDVARRRNRHQPCCAALNYLTGWRRGCLRHLRRRGAVARRLAIPASRGVPAAKPHPGSQYRFAFRSGRDYRRPFHGG